MAYLRLLIFLQKHLMHLKVIQTMSKVPRSIGIPPLSDASFDAALNASAAQASSSSLMSLGEDEGKINPLAGMGLTDEQYTLILQNLVNNESFTGMRGMSLEGDIDSSKRSLEDPTDARDSKRGRFEVVE